MADENCDSFLPGPRIVIVGTTGSGKTTTAARLSGLLGIPHIELDAIHWLPNWVEMEREPFRQKVSEALAGPTWITDGNYRKAYDLIWSHATTLVWLDYDLPVIFWQLFWRTLRRVMTGEELWNGNRERFREAFFSKDSLFAWAVHSHPRQRKQYPQLLASPEFAHLQVFHFRSRRKTTQWLARIEAHLHKEKPI